MSREEFIHLLEATPEQALASGDSDLRQAAAVLLVIAGSLYDGSMDELGQIVRDFTRRQLLISKRRRSAAGN